MIAVAAVLAAVAALAIAGCSLLARRLDRLHTETLRHERGVNAERAVRILELERLLDTARANAVGAVPASPAELSQRAHAGQVSIGGQPVHALPDAITKELDQIDDPIARSEIEELAAYRIGQGEAPESVASTLFN